MPLKERFSEETTLNTSSTERNSWTRVVFRVLIVAVVLLLLAFFGHHLTDEIKQFELWIESLGAWAPFIFVLSVCLLPAFLFPTDPICFVAGAIFGFAWGTFFAISGMLASACLMFVISRYLAQDKMQSFFAKHPKSLALDKAIRQQGRRVLFLLRVTPIPFAPLSYFLGATSVSFKDYFLSIFGTMGTVLIGVYFGSVANHVAKVSGDAVQTTLLKEIALYTGLGVGILILILLTRWARKTLQQVTSNQAQ